MSILLFELLGGESLLMPPFKTGHLDGSKIVAWNSNRREGRCLKITVSIAEYMKQRLEDNKLTLVPCRTQRLVAQNLI